MILFYNKNKVIKICEICGRKRIVKITSKRIDKDRCWPCSQKQRKIPHGKKHGNFKHGIHSGGYKRIFVNDRIFEHVYVMEKHLKRKLKKGEIIHHIDFNKLNNEITNLYICSNSEHMKMNKNLGQLGYIFLNKSIWFNRHTKKYTFNKIINPILKEPKIIFPSSNHRIYMRRKKCKKGENVEYYAACLTKKKSWKAFHKVVIESFLKRKVKKGKFIHHINGNDADNSINNLCVVTNREHRLAHNSLLTCMIELYRKDLIIFNNGNYILKLKVNQ